MTIEINGTPRELTTETTLADLLAELNLDARHLVIELNRQIITRQQHADTRLQDGDQLELVHFVGGG
ncbi:MAG: sulfur carrier protein ThiS [Desulfuromonadales bacterium]|nr:sulfur carrier protein ThiS [Desulfuromonadales bacterium]